MLRTAYDFTLPCGLPDAAGGLHREGTMRLATALDELEAMQDPRVRANAAYLPVVLLGRVVTRLGGFAPVEPALVERLFAADFVFLQELYVRVNAVGGPLVETACPSCGTHFGLDLTQASAA